MNAKTVDLGGLAVVTGAASGIGLATALALAAHGSTVICADLDAEGAEEAARQVDARGGHGIARQLDVADADAWEAAGDWIAAELGVPDVLVNNAGIGMSGPFMAHSAQDWRRLLDVNLLGVVHGCRVVGGRMATAGGRRRHLVNMASAAAFTPNRDLPAYSTTKAGVLMLSECLRAELASAGVGVSAICPGFINTNIYSSARFVGTDAATEAKERERAVRLAARFTPGPEVVARAVISAIQHNRAVVPVTGAAWASYFLAHLAPAALRALARVRASRH